MRRIAVINQKGGVGKTTTTVNLGAAMARRGKRVLLLDLDPQANLTLHLDQQPGPDTRTMTHILVDGEELRPVVQGTSTANLSMIPSDTSLGGAEQALVNRIGRETILREALGRLGSDLYDIVLMDCPPSLGVLAANALVAADDVLVPMQAEYFSLQGMAKLFEVVELVSKHLNPDLEVRAIIPCMVDLRTNLTSEVLNEIRNHFGSRVCQSMIRANVKLAEAPSFGRTIFEHAPDSNGAQDYAALATEFLSAVAPMTSITPEGEPAKEVGAS